MVYVAVSPAAGLTIVWLDGNTLKSMLVISSVAVAVWPAESLIVYVTVVAAVPAGTVMVNGPLAATVAGGNRAALAVSAVSEYGATPPEIT
jgi:hypothetical protein